MNIVIKSYIGFAFQRESCYICRILFKCLFYNDINNIKVIFLVIDSCGKLTRYFLYVLHLSTNIMGYRKLLSVD